MCIKQCGMTTDRGDYETGLTEDELFREKLKFQLTKDTGYVRVLL